MNYKFLNICLIIMFALSSVAFSAEVKKQDWGENSGVFNSGFENQDAVSDKKFQNTLKMLKERSLSAKQRKMRRDVKPNAPSYDYDHLKDFSDSEIAGDDLKNALTVMIPVKSYNDDGVYLSPGYYKLSCKKVSKDTYVLELSQGTRIVMSVPAFQTNQDLKQDSITFCNAEVIDNNRIRLMYGTVDLNLVAYLYFE